jgi:hypothetical protein
MVQHAAGVVHLLAFGTEIRMIRLWAGSIVLIAGGHAGPVAGLFLLRRVRSAYALGYWLSTYRA